MIRINSCCATLLLVCAPLGCGDNETASDAGALDASSDVIEERKPTDADPFGDRIDMVLALTGDAEQGANLYAISCSNCHDSAGEAVPNKGVRVRDAVERIGRRAVVHRLIAGAGDFESDAPFMPTFSAVSNQSLANLLAHLEAGFADQTGND